MSGEEESEEEEESRPEDTGPSEAELAMQRRRAAKKIDTSTLDEESQELLEANSQLRAQMEEEIMELRQRSERRKKEREQEERELAARRSEEEARRKKEEEERNSKKLAEEEEKRKARAAKMAEFEKWKNVSSPNFVITKKSGDAEEATEGEDEEGGEKKSKEQLEAEKRAILEQRIPKLDIAGADSGKLTEKAKELHALIMRLESEKYDLEKRFKTQQYDMMELAERARQMNKVGRGGLKRVTLGQDEQDLMQEKFAGCPSRILMFSPFERQKDMRSWRERRDVFTGPMYRLPEGRVEQRRILKFNEADGQPFYEYIPGMEPKDDEEE